MATLLRWTLITVLLLRVAAGSVWAMPTLAETPPKPGHHNSLSLPCHTVAADTDASQGNAGAQTHPGAQLQGHGAHCALCFPAVAAPITVVLVPLGHARPLGSAPVGAPWMRAPELRPPI